MSHEKGPDLFVDAMDLLADLDVEASLVGDGPLEAELRRRAASDGGAGPRLRFHGAVAGAAELLPAFDLLVMSSRTEGTPILLLEALAIGTPVVATAVGGVPDLVGGGAAELVEPESPLAIAAAVRALLLDPERRAALGRAGRDHVRARFRKEEWVGAYEQLYRSLGAGRGRGA
jgi:glycosyltransferase involved in cell wall biosynthesis